MLSGEFRHLLDAKNRISVPASMRDYLGARFTLVRSIRGKCLRFYQAEDWNAYVAPLDKLPRKVSEPTKRLLYHNAMEPEIDSLGRIRISRELLESIGVSDAENGETRELMIVGCGDFGEIWSVSEYEKEMNSVDTDALLRVLEESGL